MPRLAVWLAALVVGAALGPASAQIAETTAVTVKAADTFLDKGVLGAVAVLAFVAAGLLYWALRSSQEARIADGQAASRELMQVNKESTEALRVNAEAMSKLANTVEASTKGADERWRTLGDLLMALTPIQTGIASNGSSLGRMEADIRAMLDREARR